MMKKSLLIILLALTLSKVRAQNFIPAYFGSKPLCGINGFYNDTLNAKFYVYGMIPNTPCGGYNYIACFSNNAWSFLGAFDGQISSVVVFNGELFASGWFQSVNSQSISNLAKYNGSTWQAVPNFTEGGIYRLKAIENELYVCGSEIFTTDGVFNGVAKFNGAQWSGLAIPYLGDPGFYVKDIAIYQGNMVVGGNFYLNAATQDLIYYNNGQWQKPGLGLSGGFTGINVMQEYKGILYIGGLIYKGGYNPSNMLVAWNGTEIIPVGDGIKDGVNSYGTAIVHDMLIFKDKLFIAGDFNYAANIFSCGLTIFDGYTFCSLDKNEQISVGLGAVGVFNDTLWIAGSQKYLNDSIYGCGKYVGAYSFDTCSYQLNVGIEEQSLGAEFSIFPNPFHNKLNIEYNNASHVSFKIFDVLGKEVYFSDAIQSKEIELEFLPRGIYFLRLLSPDLNKVFKIVKE